MHFSGTTPNEIYKWIDARNYGDSTDYYRGKQDTQEAIEVFRSLYGMTFMTANHLFTHLHNTLKLRVTNSESQYRSFIALNNDEITTLRLSKHFATKNSMKTAKKRNGKPDVEYHLVIGRIQSDPRKDDIYNDGMFSGVEVMVRDIDLSEFNDGDGRKGIIDEIIALLTNGTTPSNTNENKNINCNRNMNKKLIRLTESDLHRIVRESVNKVLKEEVNSFDLHNDINRLSKTYDDNLEDYYDERGYYQDDENDYWGNWQDMSDYEPGSPEAKSYWEYANRVDPYGNVDKENERSWREFNKDVRHPNLDRELEYRKKLRNGEVQTSSTLNPIDSKGNYSMFFQGNHKIKFPKRLYKMGKDTILSKKAPKQNI